MIISGYQGIGKSTVAGKNNCIDLESGSFVVDGVRSDDWYKAYCQVANHLSSQGYVVLVSSHKVVIRELEKSKEKVCVIFPGRALKELWVSRLKERYDKTGLEKDFKAFANAEKKYDESIIELMNCNLQRYEITDMNYDLEKIVNNLSKV